MSLEQKLHELWNLDPTLPGLVPSERVFTGCPPPGTAPPYVVLERRAARTVRRTSGPATVELVECVWQLRTTTYDEASALATALADCFDRQAFTCDEGEVLQLRQVAETRRLPRPDRPELDVTYEATLVRSG